LNLAQYWLDSDHPHNKTEKDTTKMKECLKQMSCFLAAVMGFWLIGTIYAAPVADPIFKDGFEHVDIPQIVTLAGVVRDDPIPFATVTVTVGGNTFTTVADENGNFVIQIAGIDLSSLVLIESTGENPTDENKTVDMASVAGTLAKLVEDADGDGIVDGTENPNINNTPYTTALFVLLGEANGGETPDTLEELQDAERSVEATEILELAAVIKLVVDGGFALPNDPSTGEPYETIISFLADAEVDVDGDTPVENFIAANDTAIQTAVEEILADNDIVPAFTTEGIPDRYYSLVPAQAGFLSRYGRAYDFADSPAQTGEIRAVTSGGTGVIYEGHYNWEVVNGKLSLDWTVEPIDSYFAFQDPTELTLRCREPNDPQFDGNCPYSCADYEAAFAASPYFQLAVTEQTSTTELTRYAVSAGGSREFASQTDVVSRQFASFEVDLDGGGPNPPEQFQFCDEIEARTSNVELLNDADNPPRRIEVSDYAAKTLALYIIYDPDDAGTYPESLYMDFVTLNNDAPDGDGYRSTTTLLSGASLEWRIVSDGLPPSDTNANGGPDGNELQFKYAGGVQQTLKQLEPPLGAETAFWVEVNGVSVPYGRYDITLLVDPLFQFDQPFLINETGQFWNAVLLNAWPKTSWQTNALGQLELTGPVFGWEFSAIPDGFNLQAGFAPNPITWGILASPLSAGLGQLQQLPAGTVNIVRFESRNRYWIPIAKTMISEPGNVNHAPTLRQRFYVVEMEYQINDGSMWIAPRINASEIYNKTVLD
jgi:hypothetical protein